LSIISINHGIGRHIVHLTIPNAMTAAKMNIIAQPLNVLALYFVKISIVFFLVRLRPDKKFLYVLYFTLGLLTVITIEVFVVTMAQCQPIAKGWNPTLPGLCWSPNVFQNSAYALSGKSDVRAGNSIMLTKSQLLPYLPISFISFCRSSFCGMFS